MKIFYQILFAASFVFNLSYCQETTSKHTVLKGETITQIAQKYKTTPDEVYKLNPNSQSGINENQILVVPSLKAKPENSIVHIVAPKETLFGLATLYNVKVETIQNENSTLLANGLKVGQELIIPQRVAKKTFSTSKTHIVQPKESLFSISRLYNVSVEDLSKANSELLVNGLQIDQKINIPNKKKTLDGRVRVINAETIFYVVQAKETKYSIAKQFGITIEQLETQNPEIVNGLTEGNTLAINVKEITPTNENEELMIALAEKQVVIEKSKANTAEIKDLKDKLALQKTIDQKVLDLNNLLIELKHIDGSKETSSERLKLVIDANKKVQDMLLSKLDSLVNTMDDDLIVLKKAELVDLEESKRMEQISSDNIAKTNELSFQLKKQLADNRKVYSSLMNKAERIAVEENLEYKKSVRENSKVKPSTPVVKTVKPEEFDEIKFEQDQIDKRNEKLIKKLDSINYASKSELRLHISKAEFYGKEARSFDDKLAKVKIKSYQNKAYESQTVTEIAPPTSEEIKKELEKDSNKDKIVKAQIIDNLKDVKNGYYIVLGEFQDGKSRDKFILELTDMGYRDSNFFYNVNILAYDVYTNVYTSKEEAVYNYLQNENKALFENMVVVNVANE